MSRPWDPWLPVMEHSRLFAQRTVRPSYHSSSLFCQMGSFRGQLQGVYEYCPRTWVTSQPQAQQLHFPEQVGSTIFHAPLPHHALKTQRRVGTPSFRRILRGIQPTAEELNCVAKMKKGHRNLDALSERMVQCSTVKIQEQM